MIARKWVLGLALTAALPLMADDDDRWRRGRDRDRDRDVYSDRDRDRGRWGGIFGGRSSRNDVYVVDQAISNLRRAAARNRYDSHERNHFDRALHHLGNFRDRYRRDGRFDRGRLSDAIDHIKDLAQANQIHPRDRQTLARDLRNLREFRERGGDFARRW